MFAIFMKIIECSYVVNVGELSSSVTSMMCNICTLNTNELVTVNQLVEGNKSSLPKIRSGEFSMTIF